MTLDYLLAEAQAYAGPLWLGSKERYKDAVNHFGQDALSVIADGNLYVAVGIAFFGAFCDLHHNGTFNTFLLQLTTNVICIIDMTVEVI